MEKDKILQILKDLSAKMGASVDGIDVSEAAGHTLFTIRTKDSGALIGARGETLSALNHIVKKTLEGKQAEGEPFRFVIDVNGYHLKHIKMLESQAHMLAERARTFKYDIEMSPMSPYDRMIVHAALQTEPNIKTVSEGEGALRHIIVKYVAEGAGAVATEAPQN